MYLIFLAIISEDGMSKPSTQSRVSPSSKAHPGYAAASRDLIASAAEKR
jgi:hypothetical protein